MKYIRRICSTDQVCGTMMAADPERHKSILNVIQSNDFAALASFSPTEVLLLTGYWPVMGSSVAMFTRAGKVCVLVPEDELELAQATSAAEIISYKPSTLHQMSEPAEALLQPLMELAACCPLNNGPIAVHLSDASQPASYQSVHHYRYSIVPLLHRAYPDARVTAGDSVFDKLQAIKTPVEIGQLRRACSLASAGFKEASRAIAQGRREDEVAADIGAAFARVANRGFERGAGYFFCMSGPNSFKASGAYARTRSRVLEEGDLAMIHANTVGDGFWTDITRTYVVGEHDKQQQRMHDAIAEARQAALDAIRPGRSAAAIDAAARGVLASHGFGEAFKHATGHGVGFAAADPNALPRIHPKSPDVLEAGMTFNIEPAIYIEGVGGMRHCDVVACTESGVEVLTDF
jgi:Xaa-Pro aminopeptidase